MRDTLTERDYIIVDGEKRYIWFDIYEDGYKDGNIIQNFIMSYIDFEYSDNDIDFKEKELKAYKEILKDDGTWETIFLNTFIVTTVNQNDTTESVTVRGFDYGLKYTNQYASNLIYQDGTITLQAVSDEINTKLGMNNAMLDVNANFIVDNDQFTSTGVTDGTVISLIAGASGNRARIFQDKLVYQFANETTKVLTKGEYTTLEDKRDTHPITIVILGQTDIEGQEAIRRDEELIEEYGENYLILNDNLFAYTLEKREALIDGIFNKVKGFGYSSFIANGTNAIDYNIGDVIQFENADGGLTKSIVLRKSTTGTEIVLEAPSITKATISYQRPEPALVVAKRAEIVANRAEGTVSTITQTTETLEKEINNNYQDLNNKLEGYATTEEVSVITNSVEQLQTSTDLNISIIQDIQENGVDKVTTTTGYTFDEDGLEISKTGAKVSNILDETGMSILDKTGNTDSELMFAGYDEELGETIVRSKNINVEKYLTIGKNSRIEDFEDGTGIFYVGGGN